MDRADGYYHNASHEQWKVQIVCEVLLLSLSVHLELVCWVVQLMLQSLSMFMRV